MNAIGLKMRRVRRRGRIAVRLIGIGVHVAHLIGALMVPVSHD